MNDWTSYRLQDFIPFTGEVYFRLMERMGETFWPLHLLTLALGVGALLLTLKSRPRSAFLLIAPVWVFVAVAFFMQRYGELNWAGSYLGYGFLIQAFLLIVISVTGLGMGKSRPWRSPPVLIGVSVVLFGLTGLPVMAPLTGGSWYQAQVFGVHPDPTAVTLLGLVLIGLRGLTMWLAAVIPVLWLLVSGLTLLALDAPGSVTLFVVIVIVMVGLVARSLMAVMDQEEQNGKVD